MTSQPDRDLKESLPYTPAPSGPTVLSYDRAGKGIYLRWPFVAAVALSSVILLIGIAPFIVTRASGRDGHSNKVRCANNLRQIALACLMYANQYHGNFPPSVAAIIDGPGAQEITPNVFVCPDSRDEPLTLPIGNRVDSELRAMGHLSYVYVGRDLRFDAPTDTVLLYEPLSNHGDGTHVAYVDAHVNWVSAAQFDRIVNRMKASKHTAGTRP